MRNLRSLFLSQAYQDCWDDYNRSLKLKNFPRWDYVILTASNEQQAEGFRRQIEERKDFLLISCVYWLSIQAATVSVCLSIRLLESFFLLFRTGWQMDVTQPYLMSL